MIVGRVVESTPVYGSDLGSLLLFLLMTPTLLFIPYCSLGIQVPCQKVIGDTVM